MVFDITPRRFWAVPTLRSVWDEDDDLVPHVSPNSGLSVSEDDKTYIVEAAVPGINPDDVDVTFQDGYVWIHGEAKEEEKDKGRKYYRQSVRSFSYRVMIPRDIDNGTEPEASYKNGVMTVTFTKSPKAQPKKIKIRK